ncbi:MAG TPA: hypothetical protein VK154_02805 [Chitinophagales bacterium]|nr:hypothetical protein [Chitinophagales bacterium]
MNTIKTFFAAHKTTIMLASAALVIGAKSLSFVAQNNQAPVMDMPTQEQMMQYQGGQMPQGHNQQMPQGYGEQMPQQGGGFFSEWFGGEEGQGGDYSAYNNAANAGQNYGAQSVYNTGGYSTGGYHGGGYNPSAGAGTPSAYSSGADYTSYQQPNTDGSHERFIDAIREETKYNDADGNSYKLSSGYDYNYVNSSTNEYVQTNDASVTPSAYSSYSAVTPSDYSSSSSTTNE